MSLASTATRPTYLLVRRPFQPTVPSLDDTQRQVVAHRRGPLLVFGGPGTGKTTTLIEAVAARVAEGTDPQRLLVLTFSRRGAAQLRTRIAARIAAEGRACGELSVRTFHSYAFAVLRRLATRHGDPPPRLLNGPEQDLVIRELLAHDTVGWPVALRAALRTRGFAAELRDLLLRAAERGVRPDQLAEFGRELGRDDWVAAARFAREYASVLALRDATTHGAVGYDTAELIRVATGRLAADTGALAAERSRARFTYVDEIHDLDPAQWDLLELVAGGGANLVGFGDPDSSLFAFRGADPAGMWRMPERFRDLSGEPSSSVTLHTCWRSGPVLVAAAERLAERLRGPGKHRVRHSTPEIPDGVVEVRLFRSVTQEATYLAQQLRVAHLLDGVPWSAMAVLMRSASVQLPGLRRALTQSGVPVRVAADDLPLAAQPATAPLLLLLRCALDPGVLDEETAVALLHSPLGGSDPFAERRLRQGLRGLALAAGDRRPSGALLAEALSDPAELAALDAWWVTPARRVADLLATVREAVDRPDTTAEQALWELWQASGLAERWAAASASGGPRGAAADRDLDAVLALFDAAAGFTDRLPGAGPRAFLDHLTGQQIPGDSLAPAAETGEAVSLLTVHSAKGLEWDLVVVPGVQEGRWPDLRLRGSVLGSELLVDVVSGRAVPGERSGSHTAVLDEERRLCFVAATRARTRLIVTAVVSGDGEEQPSRFLDELAVPEPGPGPVSELDLDAGSSLAGVRYAEPPQPLALPALVARLRTVVADPEVAPGRRRAAARQLARLAGDLVPGAHPDQWWGLRPLSDSGPLAGPGETVTVSPSTVEQVRRCGLRWLLERHGGGKPAGTEQTVGSLVHAAAERVDRLTRPELYRYLDEHWGVVEVAARWEESRKREQAEQMVERLARWVAGNPRELVATEQRFRIELPGTDIELAGAVDRVERDATGRLVIVDFKTGKSPPTGEEVRRHPQLGTYQLAVALGGFVDLSHRTEPGGAALVQLGRDRRVGPEQHQPPLSADEDPGWARDAVRDAAATMAGASFTARVNPHCGICAVRTSCPVSEHGRQVVAPEVTDPPAGGDGGPP